MTESAVVLVVSSPTVMVRCVVDSIPELGKNFNDQQTIFVSVICVSDFMFIKIPVLTLPVMK